RIKAQKPLCFKNFKKAVLGTPKIAKCLLGRELRKKRFGRNWAQLGAIGRNWAQLGATGRNWAQLGATGRNRAQNGSAWSGKEKPPAHGLYCTGGQV
ncbi:MAG: hypothetical protein SVV80_09445, partial [Planctomycetota bacterium]|nr:hypothetical protein [Planctomycetota bacterium]